MEKVRAGALESTKRSSRRIGRRSRTVLGVEEAAAGACRRQGAAGGAGGAAGGAGIGEEGWAPFFLFFSLFYFGGSSRRRCRIYKAGGLCPGPVVWQN